MDYGKTLNLPQTEFPMRGNLPAREPEILKMWEDRDLYQKLMKKNEGRPLFVLHDGPPYANGDMHMGHALNKTLKDIITRYKNMSGHKAPYIHGWDTHGLPIERQAIEKLGIDRHKTSISEFRKVCSDFALGYVKTQKKQIKRLGAIGDFDRSYLTLNPEYEAKQIEIFGEMAKKGYIYKGLKPIYWCPDCETALAEAEIAYSEDKTDSIYVKFQVSDDRDIFTGLGIPKEKVSFVIWTTTTWTLPGNVAIALNGDFDYSLIKAGDEYFVVASGLTPSVMSEGGIEEYEVVAKYKGGDLEYVRCRHPFLDRESVVILGDHVTLDAGTGCVHTAPGHGAEDFDVCKNYDGLPVIVPVDSKGYLNEHAGEFAGLFYEKSNAKIIERLRENGALFATKEIVHQYPHCWRCHEPIVFRATEQWFASVDAFKNETVEAIKGVKWIPAWGEDRITAMVLDRSDWCISRQRTWGVPLPIFYCEECGREVINDDTIKAVSDLFGKKGSGAWYETPAEDILPAGLKCENCGHTKFRKETDIMDVWFDSGSSHSGVLDVYPELSFPADMYLEGNDQYRGWFQSSLLTSVAARGQAPYKSVVTHGMIVDAEGQKMSKSKGNGISPIEIIETYGADILRLWVNSADYKTDMRISNEILKQLSEAYRKIRNTARYILGNISDFDPENDMVDAGDLTELDRWALSRLNNLIKRVVSAYEDYEFHIVYHAIHNFCIVDMSNFYLDVIKDRLYTEKSDGKKRRAAQTAMYRVLDALTRMLAPVLCYTAEEIWQAMPHKAGDNKEFVLLNDMPETDDNLVDAEFEERWERFRDILSDVSKALEAARNDKVIGKSLDASVTIYADGKTREFIESFGDIAALFIVSEVNIHDIKEAGNAPEYDTGVKISVTASEHEKCERCWIRSDSVGENHEHPSLCARCADVLKI
jgi:isoleucyl-tRNA synthetase